MSANARSSAVLTSVAGKTEMACPV